MLWCRKCPAFHRRNVIGNGTLNAATIVFEKVLNKLGGSAGVQAQQVMPDQNLAGARVDSDEYEKEDARDFVLWKACKENEPSWDTEIGNGRPG